MDDPDRYTLDDFNTIPVWETTEQSPFHENGDRPHDEDTWQPINLADLPDKPPIEPTLGGVGLVYPGKRHVFSGPQESAKTLLAYAIGIEVIRAGGILIVIDFEMGAYDARDRLRELGATHDDLHQLLYIEPGQPAEPRTAERLLEHDPALVIVDAAAGAYDLQGLDDNKRSDVERFTSLYIKAFWKAAVATIVLDHVVKQGRDRRNYAIGSERKVGGADVHLGFEVVVPVKRGGHGLYKIHTHKDRPGFLKRGKLADLELRSDDQHRISWELIAVQEDEQPFRPTHLMEKVSKYLEQQSEPVSRNNVETTVGGKAEFIRKALDVLTLELYVVETKGAKNARMVTSQKSYRHDQDPQTTTSSDLVPTSSGRSENDLVSSSPPYGGTDGVEDEDELNLVPDDDLPL